MNWDEIEIKTIEKLDLQSGDVLAVYTKDYYPTEEREQIEKRFINAFSPKVIRVIVINAELVKLQALRIEDK